MKIRFHEKLYCGDIPDKKQKAIRKKISAKKPKLKLYLIVLPTGNQGILEIYWYPELLQKPYQKIHEEIVVVGIALSRDEAYERVCEIVSQIGVQGDEIPVKQFFEESK